MIAKNNSFIKGIFIITVVFFIALIYLINFIIKKEVYYQDKIYPHVFIDDQNFQDKSKNAVIDYYENKNKALKNIIINFKVDNQTEASLSGEILNLHYNAEGLADRVFLIGRSQQTTSKIYQKLSTLFNFASFQITSNLEYDHDQLNDWLNNLEEKYNLPAKNALFKFENGRVVSFRKESTGSEISADKFRGDFEKTLSDLKAKIEDKKIDIEQKVIQPEITLSKANDFGIEEFLGEGVSDFSHSIPERIHNLTLASSKFNGVLIPKNAVFSFNDTLGDVSSLTGYKPAYIIKSGKTVLGDGGGVCQVSTTFFRAALNIGLPIVERHAHAYRVLYYENDSKPGFDATVYAPSVDLKIRNDTPASILIQTEIDKNKNLLYFRFYGKKDGRKAEISKIKLYDVAAPPEPLYQDDPTLKKGTKKQVDFAAWGGKASFDYKVSKDENVIFEKTFFSSYRPWRAVYLVGTAD